MVEVSRFDAFSLSFSNCYEFLPLATLLANWPLCYKHKEKSRKFSCLALHTHSIFISKLCPELVNFFLRPTQTDPRMQPFMPNWARPKTRAAKSRSDKHLNGEKIRWPVLIVSADVAFSVAISETGEQRKVILPSKKCEGGVPRITKRESKWIDGDSDQQVGVFSLLL